MDELSYTQDEIKANIESFAKELSLGRWEKCSRDFRSGAGHQFCFWGAAADFFDPLGWERKIGIGILWWDHRLLNGLGPSIQLREKLGIGDDEADDFMYLNDSKKSGDSFDLLVKKLREKLNVHAE